MVPTGPILFPNYPSSEEQEKLRKSRQPQARHKWTSPNSRRIHCVTCIQPPFQGSRELWGTLPRWLGLLPTQGLCCSEQSHPSSGMRSRDNHSRSETRGSGIRVPHGLRGPGFSPVSCTGLRARQPRGQLPSLAGQGCGLSASMSKTEAAVPLHSFHPRHWQSLLGRAPGTAPLGSFSKSLPILIKCRFMKCEAGRGPWEVGGHMVPRPLGALFWPWAASQDTLAEQVSVEFSPLVQCRGAGCLTSRSAASHRWWNWPLHDA